MDGLWGTILFNQRDDDWGYPYFRKPPYHALDTIHFDVSARDMDRLQHHAGAPVGAGMAAFSAKLVVSKIRIQNDTKDKEENIDNGHNHICPVQKKGKISMPQRLTLVNSPKHYGGILNMVDYAIPNINKVNYWSGHYHFHPHSWSFIYPFTSSHSQYPSVSLMVILISIPIFVSYKTTIVKRDT